MCALCMYVCPCVWDYKREEPDLEGADESVTYDFLCVEHFDLHDAVKHFLRSLVEAEVEHLKEDQTPHVA